MIIPLEKVIRTIFKSQMFLDVFLICKWFVYRTFLYGFFSFHRDNLIFISLMLAKNQSVSITMFICFDISNFRSDLFCLDNYLSLSSVQVSVGVAGVFSLSLSPSRGASLCSPLSVHQMTVLAAAATGGLLVGGRLEVVEAGLASTTSTRHLQLEPHRPPGCWWQAGSS